MMNWIIVPEEQEPPRIIVTVRTDYRLLSVSTGVLPFRFIFIFTFNQDLFSELLPFAPKSR